MELCKYDVVVMEGINTFTSLHQFKISCNLLIFTPDNDHCHF